MATGGKKAETHDRIVRAAAKAIRRDGYAETGVAEVMHEAGLTHGGFYAHFSSREAMLAEALDRAAADANASLAERATGDDPLAALVASYLSDRHVAATDAGCTIAALGGETRRQGPAIRKVATRHLTALVDTIAKLEPAVDPLAALSTLVGALVIARIVDDPALSKRVREAAARVVTARPKKRR